MATLAVEVVYALPGAAHAVTLRLPAGATVADAVAASGLAKIGGQPRLGIHGREVEATRLLADGDRVEIYRPLAADPKEARRLRAKRRG